MNSEMEISVKQMAAGQENNKGLIFLENETQVRDCLRWISGLSGKRVIIALSPFAMHELDRHGMSYKIPEEYYDPQDLYKMGMANFQKVEELCDLMDNFIQKSCQLAKKGKIRPALFNYYQLKMVYDAMTIRIFQLSSIFNAEKPDIVYIYSTEKYPFGCHENAPFIQFDNRESIYVQLLAIGNWKFHIKILQSNSLPEKQKTEKRNKFLMPNFKIYISKHLYNHTDLMDLAIIINNRGIGGLFNWLRYLPPSAKCAPVVLLGGGYNWHEIIIELKTKQIGPIYRVHPDLRRLIVNEDFKNLDTVWMDLLNNQNFSKLFIYEDINFFSIIEERLQFLVTHLTVACIITARETEDLIQKRKIKAIVSPVISNCLEHSIARIAHNNGIPVITWQHGAYGAMHHPIINYLDLISSDFHFVFGEGIAEQYAEAAKLFNTELVPIGSATLDRLQIRYSNEKCALNTKKIVLYITANGYQNHLYISYYPSFSDNLFWQTQKAIIDTLGNHKEYSVITKLHPSPIYKDPDFQSYVTEKGFKNFQFIKNEKSTVELLSLADIIVIDFPSTTLLQALTTTKPLFVYMGHIQFDPKPYQLLAKRVVCGEKLEDFVFDLNEYLINKNYQKDLYNKDFLIKFGTSSNKGFAGERAARELRQIIDSYDISV